LANHIIKQLDGPTGPAKVGLSITKDNILGFPRESMGETWEPLLLLFVAPASGDRGGLFGGGCSGGVGGNLLTRGTHSECSSWKLHVEWLRSFQSS
jgi:hypothetical protein